MEETEFSYVLLEDHAKLLKWKEAGPVAEVPADVEGLPVTEVEAYAFAEGAYTHIYLPPFLKKVGRYAFYNCFSLQYLGFFTGLSDIGAGAFTGCHQVRMLEVTETPGRQFCFGDILSEFGEEMEVRYHGEGEARLLFPEYYEEGVENTPARILMTQVHGSGLLYRNCFVNRKLQFEEYDSRFVYAMAQETPEFLVRLAMGRLFCPYGLSEKAEKRYSSYIEEHLQLTGCELVRGESLGDLEQFCSRYFTGEGHREVLEALIYKAQELGKGELLSYLMEVRHRHYPARRTDFIL